MRYLDLFESERTGGTYMAAAFSQQTQREITQYLELAKVPEPVVGPSLHCTIVYSRTPVDIQPNYDCSLEAVSVKGLELWPVSDGKHVLVLVLDSAYLHGRFAEAIALGATYDYDEYKPHVTLSYDAGGFNIKEAPPVMFDLQMDCEYVEELVT